MIAIRLCIFLLIFSLWLWSSSIFAPWALSLDPRLWLYDLLFYTRYALLFWGAFELMLALRQIWNEPPLRRRAFANISVLGFAAFCISAYAYLMQTGGGFELRVRMSAQALAELRQPTFSDQRRRAGWFLIDNQRQPCIDQPWLWLGEMYGGGSGNNLALVYSEKSTPKTPVSEAFRFMPLPDHWWLAYQNPENYFAHLKREAACGEGAIVDTHQQGKAFVAGRP